MKKNIQRVGCGCGDRPPSGPSILRFGGLVEKRKTHKTPDESFNQGIFVVSVLVQHPENQTKRQSQNRKRQTTSLLKKMTMPPTTF
jgi:cytochrome c-type biogenesis protein CcmE